MNSAKILADQQIRTCVQTGAIHFDTPLDNDQIQPASMDLRLGRTAYRLRASFLPGRGVPVKSRLTAPLVMHEIDLTPGAVLETGCIYLVPLIEGLSLPNDICARTNPKSSTGRIDVFTRVIMDGATAFDTIAPGYKGGLWLEISPRTFSILVRPGDRLAQIRLRGTGGDTGGPVKSLDVSLALTPDALVGYRAKRHAGVLDLRAIGGHDPRDYWEALCPRNGQLILDPGEFYILASKEAICIPPDMAAEMAPIAPEIGEFRVHYAGFFDPGFGYDGAGGAGAKAVLEVRGRDVPFILEDGQTVAKLVFEPMSETPSALYGATGSNYQGQGLKLSKLFAAWE